MHVWKKKNPHFIPVRQVSVAIKTTFAESRDYAQKYINVFLNILLLNRDLPGINHEATYHSSALIADISI